MKICFRFLIVISTSFLLFSCFNDKVDRSNETFKKKYGHEVAKIRTNRLPLESSKMQKMSPIAQHQRFPSYEELSESTGYYPYFDVSNFSKKNSPKQHFPNSEVYYTQKAQNPSNRMPRGMFRLAYNTDLHPPFRKFGAEFDRIYIPKEDAYGVETRMSNKPYLLAGNDSLQKNIDQINRDQTREDIELSQILIKEQKQLKKRQRIVKIFGRESITIESLEDKEAQKGAKNIEKKEESLNPNVSKASLEKNR